MTELLAKPDTIMKAITAIDGAPYPTEINNQGNNRLPYKQSVVEWYEHKRTLRCTLTRLLNAMENING